MQLALDDSNKNAQQIADQASHYQDELQASLAEVADFKSRSQLLNEKIRNVYQRIGVETAENEVDKMLEIVGS